MMRFRLQSEPALFDRRCRQRGRKWLQNHRDYRRPENFWSEFEPDLREAFRGLCAYCAMRVFKADVDHFIPFAVMKAQKQERLAYEWSNFRYGAGMMNQRKQNHRILDPFKVRDRWFEILLPSLQLVLADTVPQKTRPLAEFTLERLGLVESEVVVRYRKEWFDLYRERKLTLDGLRNVAPLVARAVETDLKRGKDWRH